MLLRRVLPSLLLVLVAGCSWLGGSDNSIPPADLKDIAQPTSVQQIWETQVGSGTEKQFIRLMPALADGRIFAASHDGTVVAVDAVSGQMFWKTQTDLPISGGVGVSANDLVLVGTSEGQIIALQQENGQEVWQSQVSSEILAPPRADRGIVVVHSIDGKFIGLNAKSGEKLWSFTHIMPALSLRGTAPPLVAGNVVVAGLDTGKLLVLTLDRGLPITEKTIAPPRGRTEIERLIDIDSEPKAFGESLYLVAYHGNIAALNMRSGNLEWQREISSYAGLDVDERHVYVSDESDAVLALDRQSGGTMWKQSDLTGRRLSAPAVTSDGYVVVGDYEGYLHWLDKEDGRIIGRIRATSKSIITPPLSVGSTVFVYGKGGTLGAFRIGG